MSHWWPTHALSDIIARKPFRSALRRQILALKHRSAGVSGIVILHAIISKDGKPLSLRFMNSQIHADLARSAVEAVSQWRYTPTLLNGEPIEVDTTIMVNFSLAP